MCLLKPMETQKPSVFSVFFLSLVLCVGIVFTSSRAGATVTLLIPAKPDISKADTSKEKEKGTKEKQGKQEKPVAPAAEATPEANGSAKEGNASAQQEEPSINEETDVLITRMDPFANKCFSMDMPQSFAVLHYTSHNTKDGILQPSRKDLLGDVEEILYKGEKAWGANVGLLAPGLYQFIMETRPFWVEEEERFVQHFVKVMMPVYGEDEGWHEATKENFEIVPISRPFGLLVPALFSGKVLINDQPAPNIPITLSRINTDGQKVPTLWHKSVKTRTDATGQFSVIANKTGWWCLEAETDGTPLKGADGQPKKLRLEALFWFYVDNEMGTTR